MNIPLFSSWNSRFFHSFRNFLEVHSNSVQNPLSYYSTGWFTGMPNMADDNPYMPGRFITPISQPMNQNLSTLSIGLVSLTAKTPTHWCFNTNSLTNQRGVSLCRFSPVAVVLSWRHPWRTPERKKKLNAPTNQERNCITWVAEKKPERWNGKSSPCFAFESWMWCYWCWFFWTTINWLVKKRWYVKLILVGVVVLVVLELCGIMLERTHKIMVEVGKKMMVLKWF